MICTCVVVYGDRHAALMCCVNHDAGLKRKEIKREGKR